MATELNSVNIEHFQHGRKHYWTALERPKEAKKARQKERERQRRKKEREETRRQRKINTENRLGFARRKVGWGMG